MNQAVALSQGLFTKLDLQELKESGCPGFRSNRVYLQEVVDDVFLTNRSSAIRNKLKDRLQLISVDALMYEKLQCLCEGVSGFQKAARIEQELERRSGTPEPSEDAQTLFAEIDQQAKALAAQIEKLDQLLQQVYKVTEGEVSL